MKLQFPISKHASEKPSTLHTSNTLSLLFRSVGCKMCHVIFSGESNHQHLLTSLFSSFTVNGGLSGCSRKDVLGKAVNWRIALVLLDQA